MISVDNQRLLKLDGTTNFRDLGGYHGDHGKTVKWGLIFRSDALNKLSDLDVSALEKIGLRSIVDFRSPNEIINNEDKLIKDTLYYNLNPKAEVAQMASASLANDKNKIDKLLSIANSEQGANYFANHADDMSKQMRQLVSDPTAIEQFQRYLELLLSYDSVPLVFHCRGGKDRTGIAAMFTLLALGVNEEQIFDDYLLTKIYNNARNQKRMNEYKTLTDNQYVLDYLHSLMDVKVEYLTAAFDEMRRLAGSPTNYLKLILNFSDEKIAALRNRYLED